MKIHLVSIGNSKGIRIPSVLLKQCHIEDQVDLEVENDKLIIRPIKNEARSGWDSAFKLMNERKDDELLISDSIDMVDEEWEWK